MDIREGIAGIVIINCHGCEETDCGWEDSFVCNSSLEQADKILKYLHSQGVVQKVEGELPKHRIHISPAFGETIEQEWYIKGYAESQQDMVKDDWEKTKPLVDVVCMADTLLV